MAGIGFVLRKLSRQDNLMGLFQAYVYSSLISTGPWIFTIVSLGGITFIAGKFTSIETISEFRRVVIYNFSFSLVFTAPVYMVVTRFLADSIYDRNVERTPGILVGSTLLVFAYEVPLSVWFYFGYANISSALAFSAVINFLLISEIWLISVFVTALKDYKTVVAAFGFGMLFGVLATGLLVDEYELIGILTSFSLGLSLIVALLVARIFAEYPYRFKDPFAFLVYFPKYWEVAVSGVTYNTAVWVDKWIMWHAPESDHSLTKLPLYPNYDSAMFLAYLSIVPSMAMFVMSIETNFFEHYLKFYRDIQQKATLKDIRENHEVLIKAILSSARNFIVFQGCLTVVFILMAGPMFNLFKINFLQISIYRYGVLGSFFQTLTLFINIILSYFDCRRAYMTLQTIFLVTSASFTLAAYNLGFRYYGFGFYLACVLTFVISAVYLMRYVLKLPYHTFVTTNASVQKV